MRSQVCVDDRSPGESSFDSKLGVHGNCTLRATSGLQHCALRIANLPARCESDNGFEFLSLSGFVYMQSINQKGVEMIPHALTVSWDHAPRVSIALYIAHTQREQQTAWRIAHEQGTPDSYMARKSKEARERRKRQQEKSESE